MYKTNDFVVYNKNVCKVVSIKKNFFNQEDYYLLIPIDDNSLKIEVPISNKNLRDLISKEEIEKFIKNIPNIPIISMDEKFLENEYKNLLLSGNHYNLVKIIKTTYLRNQDRISNKKRISDRDQHYFQLAEKYLYNEFSIVLGINSEEVKEYIKHEIELLAN